jgi:O-methyltransferase
MSQNDSRQLYLDLIKRCLLNLIYGEKEVIQAVPGGGLKSAVLGALKARGLQIVRPKEFDPEVRKSGKDWPLYGQTMVSQARLDNLQSCVEDVLQKGVPGDLIETGVWRGGASILMRAVLKAYGDADRTVWVADSFEGLPPPDPEKYPQDAGDIHHTFEQLAVSQEEVAHNFALYDLLDDQVKFLKGWFRDTLPTAPIEKLAVMRLDGDMYESTMDALVNLYPKLSVGGYVIIDDYGHLPNCRKAVHDFREQNNITDEITQVDWTGAYWRKTEN